jgi:hypothetical protein
MSILLCCVATWGRSVILSRSSRFTGSPRGARCGSNACLCCGVGSRLQVDHVVSAYHGGTNEPENLQTFKNLKREADAISRDAHRARDSPSASPPAEAARLEGRREPQGLGAIPPPGREPLLRLYGCAVACDVTIGRSGSSFEWLQPHVGDLLERIQGVRDRGGKPTLESITFSAPGEAELRVTG